MKRKLSLLFSLIFLLMIPASARPQAWSGIIDPSRAIDWSQAGAGSIPNRTTICSTIAPYSGTAATINNAISSCPSGQVVLLQAGTFNLSGEIIFNNRSNVTLRGAGPTQTFVVFSAGDTCNGLGADVCVINGDNNYSGDPHNVATWTGGYAKGATSITLGSVTTGSISNLHVGSQIILDQQDDASDTGGIFVCQSHGTDGSCSEEGGVGNGRAGRAQNQMVTVTSISGSGPWTIGITPGLYAPNWRTSQSPAVWWSSSLPVASDGIENMTLDHTAVTNQSGAGIMFTNALKCWVKNIRDLNSNLHKHVWLYQSSHITVRDSYLYGAQGASESYGVDSGVSTSDNLVENVICQHIATCTITEGASGSVFAYNYSVDDYYTYNGSSPNWQQDDAYHHSVGDNYLLWEGNEGIGLVGDNIHGTSFMITGFRNYWNGRDPVTAAPSQPKTQNTNSVQIMAGSRFYNLVGNVLGTPGYHTNYEFATSSSTDCGNAATSDKSVVVLGYSQGEGKNYSSTCSGASFTIPNDTLVKTTLLRWGNYDTVNAGSRFVSSEVPSGLGLFANAVPSSHTLPASLYLSSKPSWWGPLPWPAVGPDITGGTVLSVVSLNPAANCYLNVMHGLTNGSSSVLSFDMNNCYSQSSLPPPLPPTNLKVVVQ